jgi:hypothetical protein
MKYQSLFKAAFEAARANVETVAECIVAAKKRRLAAEAPTQKPKTTKKK